MPSGRGHFYQNVPQNLSKLLRQRKSTYENTYFCSENHQDFNFINFMFHYKAFEKSWPSNPEYNPNLKKIVFSLSSKFCCSRNLIGWLDSVWRIKGKFNTEVQQGWPSAFFLFLKKLKKISTSRKFFPTEPFTKLHIEFTREWFILKVFWMMIS